MDFLHVLDLLKVALFLCQMRLNKCPSWNVLHLGMFGMKWCMFVDKGRQGRDIACTKSRLPWRIVKLFRSKEICFHFPFINFMIFAEGNSSINMGSSWLRDLW